MTFFHQFSAGSFSAGSVPALRRAILLASAICAVVLVGSPLARAQSNTAQQNARIRLQLKKLLIGDAVSDLGGYDDIEKAITRFQNGDIANCKKYLDDAKKKYPKLSPAEVMLAKLYFYYKRTAQGHAMLEKAVTNDSDDPEAYLLLANFALRGNRTTEAEMVYKHAEGAVAKYSANPKRKRHLQISLYNGVSAVAERRKRWSEAQQSLLKWLHKDIEPDNATAFMRLGLALFHQAKYGPAEKAFKRANGLDKNSLAAEIAMARLYDKKDQRSTAVEWMKKAAVAHAKNSKAHLAIANWALTTNQLDLALKHADEAVRLDKHSLTGKLLRGLVARLRHDLSTAEMFYESAHLQSPGNFTASNNLALVLIEQATAPTRDERDKERAERKRKRAVEFALMNVQRYPVQGNSNNRFESASTLAWIYYKLDRVQDALRALKAVASAGGFSADSAYLAAQIWSDQQSNLEQAKRLLTSALEKEGPFVNRKKARALLDKLIGETK